METSLHTPTDTALRSLDTPRDHVTQRAYRSALLWTWRRLYFGSVTVAGRVPAQPGALYLSTHRNGGIDGAIASHAAGSSPVPVAASQITRSLWGRWTGCIEVVRSTDRERHGHAKGVREPLADALARLAAGESLLWFPEGTSDGGPTLLPVKHGAARLLAQAVEQGIGVRVLVIGLHYQQMDALQSDVEVDVAEPQELQPLALAIVSGDVRPAEIQLRIECALRAATIEYPDARVQGDIETLTARLGLPVVASRRAMLRLPPSIVHAGAVRAQAASSALPLRAVLWFLPWSAAATAWLPTLAVAYALTRRADRNNKAFIRSLVAMPLIPLNLALSSWLLAMAGLRWPFAMLAVVVLLPLGLIAHRQLRRARSQTRAMRTLRDEFAAHGVKVQ